MEDESTLMHPYRMFLSYARLDYEIAKNLVHQLSDFGLVVQWDSGINAGAPFSEEIKGFISHAHIFIVLISENSKNRLWVHQEIGYASAKNIPTLIVDISGRPTTKTNNSETNEENDLGMVKNLQTIKVEKDLSNLIEKFRGIDLNTLVNPPPSRPTKLFEIAQWPEQRTELLVKYAKRELQFRNFGKIRQKATFSSFHLPAVESGDNLWNKFDGKNIRSKYYRYNLSQERKVLEEHAQAEGARLIIDPSIKDHYAGDTGVCTRLKGLLEFIENYKDSNLEIVVSKKPQTSNVTLVGDFFCAESHSATLGGYQHTIFNFHAPSVLMRIKQFDEEFKRLLELNKSEHEDGMNQIKYVIKVVEDRINELKCNSEKDVA
ncbi:MAG: toll/interleukin-1 receptor domain-containing protein [Bacteroidota bacterium]